MKCILKFRLQRWDRRWLGSEWRQHAITRRTEIRGTWLKIGKYAVSPELISNQYAARLTIVFYQKMVEDSLWKVYVCWVLILLISWLSACLSFSHHFFHVVVSCSSRHLPVHAGKAYIQRSLLDPARSIWRCCFYRHWWLRSRGYRITNIVFWCSSWRATPQKVMDS